MKSVVKDEREEQNRDKKMRCEQDAHREHSIHHLAWSDGGRQ